MIPKLQLLFAILLFYRHNLHMLHWKVVGKTFDDTHKILDDYVSQFNTFIDEIAEILLSMGNNPLTLQEAFSLLENLDTHILIVESTENYKCKEVFNAIDIMFNDLYKVYTQVSEECEYSDIKSKFDEHQYWLRIEAMYKNKKRLDD